MTATSNVDFTKYGCFVSYGVKPITTSKPGTQDYYIKDVYKDISDYHNRRIKYFEDKTRWNSVYDKDILNKVNETNYKTKNSRDLALYEYEYSHDPNLKEIIKGGVGVKNREEEIRERYAKSTQSLDRKGLFTHYTSTYDHDNQIVQENRKDFKKAEIPNWFKNKYHTSQRGQYKSEHTASFGTHGDIPNEKFFNKTQVDGKLYSDNYDLGKGTAKASDKVVGYKGFIPRNEVEIKNTHASDPFINVMKTNHLDNYKNRIPGYQGHIPANQNNIKGNVRPYCLTTTDEAFH